MNQSFSNTSELTKLHHLSNFLGGRCPEFPYQARSCKISISYFYIIIQEDLLKINKNMLKLIQLFTSAWRNMDTERKGKKEKYVKL